VGFACPTPQEKGYKMMIRIRLTRRDNPGIIYSVLLEETFK